MGRARSAPGEWKPAYYGKKVRPVDILITESVSNPYSDSLLEMVEKATTAAE